MARQYRGDGGMANYKLRACGESLRFRSMRSDGRGWPRRRDPCGSGGSAATECRWGAEALPPEFQRFQWHQWNKGTQERHFLIKMMSPVG